MTGVRERWRGRGGGGGSRSGPGSLRRGRAAPPPPPPPAKPGPPPPPEPFPEMADPRLTPRLPGMMSGKIGFAGVVIPGGGMRMIGPGDRPPSTADDLAGLFGYRAGALPSRPGQDPDYDVIRSVTDILDL